MKRNIFIPLLMISLVVISLAGVVLAVVAGQHSMDWKKVDEAMKKGLPKTAIQELEPIIKSALSGKDYDQAAKAIAMKIALEGQIQGNKPDEQITRLAAIINDLPEPMKPTMEVILANWYWHYFQQNRWRFMQRTQVAEPSGDDITSWDLPRILAEIDQHFTAALKAQKWLQSTPITEFDDLLQKGSMSDKCRPTMYDFVVHEALRFYGAGEQAGAKSEDTFVLSADSPVFAPVQAFITWKIETGDTESAVVKAIRLYQSLLAFHEQDDDPTALDPTALADADLSRLEFGFQHAFGEDKNDHYKAALRRFIERWEDRPISARSLHALARVLHDEGELIEAHQLATQGKTRFPDSVGGSECHNLIQQIEAKSMNLSIERVWNNPWPSIDVQYRNLTKVHFRAVRYDWTKLTQTTDYRPNGITDRLRQELLTQEPDFEWSQDLPATKDYQPALEKISVPRELKPGFHFLIASPDERFREQNNQVFCAEFWISPLALVLRTGLSSSVEGFVLDADTGEPVSDAEVRAWQRTGKRWTEMRPTRSDKNGMFHVASSSRQSCLILARHGQHELATGNQYRSRRVTRNSKPYERTILFTDRALYRPGQTIRYKGICVAVNQGGDNYKTLARESVSIVFVDANGQKIAESTHRTNELGSFSGSFTAPRDRLTGRMRLHDPARRNSQAQCNVEEYKRPKFKVEVNAPETPARLGTEAIVTGTAKAYTGAPIGQAKVAYRVVREVRFPIWWRWLFWGQMPASNSQEIAHGTTTTDEDGQFVIKFPARPDPAIAEKEEPTFRFTVHADVTDTTGETRSDQRTINVGFTSLLASMTATDWQTVDRPVEVSINTKTLDGEPQAAKGTVNIYRLDQPATVQRPEIQGGRPHPAPFQRAGADAGSQSDLSDPNSWPLGTVAAEMPFATDASGLVTKSFKLDEGAYRAVLETKDDAGKAVTAILPIQVLNPTADRLAIKVPNVVAAPSWSVEPGKAFIGLWGTGYESGRAFVEIEHRGKLIQSYWTDSRHTQVSIEQGVTEKMRGGFTLHVTQVRENRAYLNSRRVDVPWTNKQLAVRWEHFVSKLKPGQEETWTAVIHGPKGEQAAAEMVATLYDASLDAYLPLRWPNLQLFRSDRSYLRSQFENRAVSMRHLAGNWPQDFKSVVITYRSLPPEIVGFQYGGAVRGQRMFGMAKNAPMAAMAMDGSGMEAAESEVADLAMSPMGGRGGGVDKMTTAAKGVPPSQPAVDLSAVSARKNLNETAFFFPQLLTDKEGHVQMKFTMPEALTEWKFLGFAHDAALRSGSLTDTAVTAKDLMVQPMPPRFVREGDTLEFTVKVTNQSPARQTGTVRLSLNDARTLKSVDQQLGNTQADRPFEVPAGQSRTYSWKLAIPDGLGFLTYKAVGSTGRLSDGEEGYLPVLSRRILVTESLPLPIRGAGSKEFDFDKLLAAADSDTLRHQSLTVQMVSNPAWYAVMSLPYLMEFPHECTEQTFNRLYANVLARHIANADPKIRRIFDQWKATPALDSPLEKNQDLKAVMLEETPWMRQSQKESEARRNVGILFDNNRLNDETARLLRKLSDQQLADGAWPWFPGGRSNDYITLYITTGFGRLRHLGADIDVAPAVKALARLDTWISQTYHKILKDGDKEKNHLTRRIALYLYGRSFFLDDLEIDAKHRAAVDYFLDQARQYWLKLGDRQSKAHVALALRRFGDKQVPADIMRSIKEHSVSDEELGMFWRDTERSWWWYRAPIETQAMMIEAFDEVMNDTESVEACRVWLLKQKQTQDWKTTKATADAIYGLLLHGTDLLASDALVEVKLAGRVIEPEDVEAGTGFYEKTFAPAEIQPEMGHVQVTKTDGGVSWGSVHWQYLEDMAKVTPYEGTPLTLKKGVFIKVNTKKGPELRRVDGPISVGDELVTRIELRVDRDMEYIHLKDQRGSGLEPVDVLSRYYYQDGLAYYQSTRDTASHFFIDYLPKGTYVFEYSARVVHRGQYQTGMAQIQCMYAPEFNSHSASSQLTVK